ncbi:MFS transporter [Xylophilus rhododendri]|uniref:MFS transporter n=1 Tax=Xylophilus rhododendri TaxID=2697032 RepID=A0A857J4Q7_9BURK|nr:MFS transporter [Xylophilus rhododendri]QHI98667.1 MFS transporter [Xylophilus rhododendri]
MTGARPAAPLSTPVLLLMAMACGLCAGGNYFNQPLLHSIARDLGIAESRAALTVTIAQVAYACGLLLLVPLADMLERRALAVSLMLLAAAGQFVSGFACGFGMLAIGTAMAGLFSVASQVLVPMAAALAAPGRSGRATGLVMSGLLTGILAARSVAGLLSGWGGWSMVYRISGAVMLLVAALLWWALPSSRNAESARYGQILRSMGTLLRRHPRLRSRAWLGALSFASVSCLFSTMALLLSGPAFRMGDTAIGLVGLVGVAGALVANLAGRWADQGRQQATTGASALLLILGWAALYLGGTHLGWFLAGMLIVDMALQGIHISNQSVVYRLQPSARGRINAVYMTAYFIGAAAGSAAGSIAWQQAGWPATCALGATLALATAAARTADLRTQQ